ncbi:FAD-binding protein [Streptomyces sp. NPDC029041]|uniref:FAD-binding oxidoreductase n=1 Tax=Streptomyces sp. NPDC029041 TaxID=3155727 RepID=UPI003410CBBB
MTTAPSLRRRVGHPATPGAVFPLPTTTEEVVRAVADAARRRQRVEVRAGRRQDNPVADPEARAVIDLSAMTAVAHDPVRRAFMIEAGARLTDVYRTLYEGWGVTLPGGADAEAVIGGHVTAGGHGSLTRSFGLAADHLHAVEVVVVDLFGHARAVVATRERNDPHRDLWWAHTGGGGNFGVVTRCWFRSPDATGTDPTALLPRPPGTLLSNAVMFPRAGLDGAAFRRLVRNHGLWHERNSGAHSPYAALHSSLVLSGRLAHKDPGHSAIVSTHLDATLPDARGMLRRYAADLTAGVAATALVSDTTTAPWLTAATAPQDTGSSRHRTKSAYLRRGLTDEQADALRAHLDASGTGTLSVTLRSFGGRANTLPTYATAGSHRDSVMDAAFTVTWQDPSADAGPVDRLRRLYRDVFASTGGVPVPGEGGSDGCCADHPDTDLADPAWNTSGVPWHRLYHKHNYRRLQRVKAKWDPRGMFRQGLGIRPA